MNTAYFPEEEEEKPHTNPQEEARLIRLIEAIAALSENKDWQTLNELHLSKEEERIERLLLSESKKNLIESDKLYRLQGELLWAKRYADMRVWAKLLKNQLNK